jgi:hypothetical protein
LFPFPKRVGPYYNGGSYEYTHIRFKHDNAAGSNMVTDGYAMYAFLGQDDRFKHYIVDHSAGQYVNSGFHTNGIENFWSQLKKTTNC